MDDLLVDFPALEDAESAMRQTVNRIDQLLDDLAAYLKPLVATWTGAASERYQQAQQEWNDAVADQQEQLAELHRHVVTAHDNHHGAVRTNLRIWNV